MTAPARHQIRADDGWQLDLLDVQPRGPAHAIVIAGHAMLVDRRTLCRPGRPTLVAALVASGLRVLVPQLRGRGASGPTPTEGGSWSYDDIVNDTGAFIALARRLEPELPICLVGHSLFGHAALAYCGLHPELPIAALVAHGVNIWNRRWQTNPARWLAMRAFTEAMGLAVSWRGYMPARLLRVGSADEAAAYYHCIEDWVRHDRWTSRDGADFHAALAHIRFPVLHVVSDGDRWYAPPEPSLRFSEILGSRREAWQLGADCSRPELRTLTPDHMGLATDPSCEPLWRATAGWINEKVGCSNDRPSHPQPSEIIEKQK